MLCLVDRTSYMMHRVMGLPWSCISIQRSCIGLVFCFVVFRYSVMLYCSASGNSTNSTKQAYNDNEHDNAWKLTLVHGCAHVGSLARVHGCHRLRCFRPCLTCGSTVQVHTNIGDHLREPMLLLDWAKLYKQECTMPHGMMQRSSNQFMDSSAASLD